MQFFHRLFRLTLNNVLFGIALMALIGGYIAIGSGVPSVRESLEMTDLQFFNAWPLKVLSALLILNLATVTWVRIPLTWPRAGVWMIHAGIITLVMGMAFYYHFKIEGQIYIHQGQTVGGFYDGAERSLVIRANDRPVPTALSLPTLPRFATNVPADGSAINRDLANIRLTGLLPTEDGQIIRRPLGEALGLPHDITVDIVGYHPYANIVTDYSTDPTSKTVGLQLTVSNAHAGTPVDHWLVESDPTLSRTEVLDTVIEHRDFPSPRAIGNFLADAMNLHTLTVHVGDVTQTLHVQIGQTVDVPGTRYHLKVENFNPDFSTHEAHEPVKTLMMLVSNDKPADGVPEMFRRVVINGKPTQTDFNYDPQSPAPKGKGRRKPIDAALQIDYTFADPQHLLDGPQGVDRRILITGDQPGVSQVAISAAGAVSVDPLTSDNSITVGPPEMQSKITIARFDHLRRSTHVIDVPPIKRVRSVDAVGVMQVMTIRVRCGDWQQTVDVPYVAMALEPDATWQPVPPITLPGDAGQIQIAFSNSWRRLPARLTLQKFDLVPYPGGSANDNLFRDFVSTLMVVDPQTGDSETSVAHMNNPIYFNHGTWLFFQAAFNRQEMASTIGIGNRPGVGVMITGCVMMAVGLMWAFYVKPILIARRKRAALAVAEKSGKLKRREAVLS